MRVSGGPKSSYLPETSSAAGSSCCSRRSRRSRARTRRVGGRNRRPRLPWRRCRPRPAGRSRQSCRPPPARPRTSRALPSPSWRRRIHPGAPSAGHAARQRHGLGAPACRRERPGRRLGLPPAGSPEAASLRSGPPPPLLSPANPAPRAVLCRDPHRFQAVRGSGGPKSAELRTNPSAEGTFDIKNPHSARKVSGFRGDRPCAITHCPALVRIRHPVRGTGVKTGHRRTAGHGAVSSRARPGTARRVRQEVPGTAGSGPAAVRPVPGSSERPRGCFDPRLPDRRAGV